MKGIIVYFSQTGNTRKVASAIHKGMSQLLEQCELAALKDTNPKDIKHFDLFGIGSPIWMRCIEPRNVRRFINDIPYSPGKHVFCFNTHDAMPKLYFRSITKRLKDRGLTVIGMRDWYGCTRTQCFPSPWYSDGHPDRIDLLEAEKFGKEMVEVSRRIYAGETQLIPSDLIPISEVEWEATKPSRANRSQHGTIKYNKEKCLYPKCHLCIDNCPFNYIDLTEPRLFGSLPDENICEDGCTFCESICPSGAISGDFDYGVKVCQEHKIEFEHLFTEAEAGGNFRRLVPLDKIGWDTPYYLVHNKRPRYKLEKVNDDTKFYLLKTS